MKWLPRPDAPLTLENLAEVDQYNLQEMLDKLDLSEDERNANEAAWVGHFNAPSTSAPTSTPCAGPPRHPATGT
jgi:hypothetical protein